MNGIFKSKIRIISNRIYRELKPYIKNAVLQNSQNGTPIMRPLFLQYDTDAEAFEQDYKYMFGDDLLVAPVLEPGHNDSLSPIADPLPFAYHFYL